MLNSETKKRIDDCRDILVGKVPDPKSQIEQITIALIYKFMDDMDNEAVELGGPRRFFSDGFSKYAWSELFRPEMTGDKRVDLYREAIETMEENPHVPQLFRDIFKNAFLPYRDPETLREFLKYINTFRYDHSEQLGDAFEYLLSVLGSQGDAGQFRTPRHIIDLMVELADPQKHESILDPACGTAGFLISSYKHILKQNSSNFDPQNDQHAFALHGIKLDELTADVVKKYKGDKLTPDERIRLIDHIKGYDISPDMVRLSLVNLYLHGFSDPHIFEYDTLTSEDRWNEYYDVIMANPPFMSPKGGIRPHKRFGVESSRSEVLFVDYIAEHLTAYGRAAVIVPEGIIFQSGTAYKKLRKMLVDDGFLLGVISLPAGMFNPYSGVKTSVLWLDKQRAKKTDKILFVKIENDGFDLGAQRRPIKLNDLPEAFKGMMAYKQALDNAESFDSENHQHLNLVDKSRIAENGDYNLSSERYREILKHKGNWEFKNISEICTTTQGIQIPQSDQINELQKGYKRYLYISDFLHDNNLKYVKDDYPNKEVIEDDLIMVNTGNTSGRIFWGKPGILSNNLFKISFDQNVIIPKYLYYNLNSELFQSLLKTHFKQGAQPHLGHKIIGEQAIPLPPLSVQEEIVAEIDSYQKIIDGARQVVDNYKPRIDIDPDWPLVELGDYVNIDNGRVLTSFDEDKNIACIKVSDMNLSENSQEIVTTSHWLKETTYKTLEINSVIFPKRGAAIATNKKRITKIPCLIDNNCMGLSVNKKDLLKPYFLYFFLVGFDLSTISNSAGIALINNSDIQNVQIPLPPIDKQIQFIKAIRLEQELVKANKELITIYEQKIKDRIARVWGE